MMLDLLIKHAVIVDGTGGPSHEGDVGIRDGRFVEIAPGIEGDACRTVEARGLVLAPGFIDIHSHSDMALLDDPTGQTKLRQGVTAEVVGNCGASLAPLTPEAADMVLRDEVANPEQADRPVTWLSYGQYAAAMESSGLSIHLLGLVGHGTLRIAAMGFSRSPAGPGQLFTMKSLLAEALEQGACGLSTGLIYPPGCFAETDELIALAEIAGRHGRFYASHIRNEAEGLLDALGEIIRIGRAAKVPVHVSHLKIAGYRNWDRAGDVVDLFEKARSEGVDITCDVYPYFRSQTTILALLPPWSLDGGVPALLSRLGNPPDRQRIVGQMIDGIPGWENMYHNAGWEKIFVSAVRHASRKELEGRSMAQSAACANMDPFEFVLSLIESEHGAVSIVSESMREDNVARFLSLPFAMVGSDGSPNAGRPHPRLYGTFPRVIRRFVRECRSLSLEDAVNKMSGMTAARLGLSDTGTIQAGRRADAVLFDPLRIVDTATFEEPRQHPEGIPMVIVNGEIVIDDGVFTGATPGRFVRP